jgi:hypothetical protein
MVHCEKPITIFLTGLYIGSLQQLIINRDNNTKYGFILSDLVKSSVKFIRTNYLCRTPSQIVGHILIKDKKKKKSNSVDFILQDARMIWFT